MLIGGEPGSDLREIGVQPGAFEGFHSIDLSFFSSEPCTGAVRQCGRSRQQQEIGGGGVQVSVDGDGAGGVRQWGGAKDQEHPGTQRDQESRARTL
ncbi:hypothetical protein Stube_23700 [Streptomyces tubercidicus]|uniref:Uncharacterized protein n=1 Tax=Streptomyces tubercidicus TaxID=47759 RepID=A0A640UPM0_9ACTN|nr:hypothetical protein Stube_23700 [Streptomyces tubercidicus]